MSLLGGSWFCNIHQSLTCRGVEIAQEWFGSLNNIEMTVKMKERFYSDELKLLIRDKNNITENEPEGIAHHVVFNDGGWNCRGR